MLKNLKKDKVFQLARIRAPSQSTKYMKTSLLSLSMVIAVVGLTGCGETPADKSTGAAAPAAPSASAPAAAQTATDAAQKVTSAAQETAQKASSAVADAASAASAKVKEALAQAQTLLGQGKFQEAQDSLKSLADLKLSADQQKLVDDLKAKIQQAMTAAKTGGGEAVKSVQGLLPKTK